MPALPERLLVQGRPYILNRGCPAVPLRRQGLFARLRQNGTTHPLRIETCFVAVQRHLTMKVRTDDLSPALPEEGCVGRSAVMPPRCPALGMKHHGRRHDGQRKPPLPQGKTKLQILVAVGVILAETACGLKISTPQQQGRPGNGLQGVFPPYGGMFAGEIRIKMPDPAKRRKADAAVLRPTVRVQQQRPHGPDTRCGQRLLQRRQPAGRHLRVIIKK